MNQGVRLLTVVGLLLLGSLLVGCRTAPRSGDGAPPEVAPEPPQRRADSSGGLLLNNGALQLGQGGRSGWRTTGDGEWGF